MSPATFEPVSQPERTDGSVGPAQMDTTEYPPEGKNAECNHDAFYMGDNGLPRHPLALADFVYCPKCGEKL